MGSAEFAGVSIQQMVRYFAEWGVSFSRQNIWDYTFSRQSIEEVKRDAKETGGGLKNVINMVVLQ
ncbi:MAG: hypothetical protein U9N46_09120 [Euryarchaeota archaeon]|nr:hypothetical protein [Euryarchaeota archaeon]